MFLEKRRRSTCTLINVKLGPTPWRTGLKLSLKKSSPSEKMCDPIRLTSFCFSVVQLIAKICKFFLDAVESKKYGWFWICPNGADKCQYRHALPPGFVLKTKEKEKDADDDDDEVTIEEQIEEEVCVDVFEIDASAKALDVADASHFADIFGVEEEED